MYKLLSHIKAVEISAYVAMPLAGITLAGLGVDVTKIVPPEGPPDKTRWPLDKNGRSIFWRELNKGKTIVEADLRDETGQQRLRETIAACDRILMVNTALPAAVSPLALREVFDDLICIELVGRFDGASAVDYTVQPLTGVPTIAGPQASHEPALSPVPTWDIAAGYLAATTVLAAHEHRRRTGRGVWARISLYALAMATLCNLGYLGDFEENGRPRPKVGNGIYGAYGQDFISSDGQRLVVVAITARQWRGLLKALRIEDVVARLASRLDVSFDDEGQRYLHSGTLYDVLAPWFRQRTAREIADVLNASQVAWAPFLTVAEGLQRFVADPASAAILEHIPGAPGISAGLPILIDTEEREPNQFAKPAGKPR